MRRLSAAADVGAARGRLPDDPGDHALPGRQPRRDDDVGDGAARAPVRPDAGTEPDVVDELGRRVGDHAAVQSLDLSLDVAEQEVQAAINAGGNLLPTDLPMPPIYSKVNPADAPMLTLAVTSPTLPVTEAARPRSRTRLAQKISQVPGVGLVSIAGGQRPAVRIQANPRALAVARPVARRRAHGDRRRQRQPGEGQLRRPDSAPRRSTPTTSCKSAAEYRT